MPNQKANNSSFLQEAMIISISHFAVKIIGVLYKVPLATMLQDSMSAFNAAYSIYAMLFMLSTSGLPVAISRMISASAEKGRKLETERVFRISLVALCAVGFVGSMAMFLLAEPMAVWSKHENAVWAIRVISPTLFFVCITSTFRGYFQGLRNMYPTAISQFIEAVLKFALGMGAAVWARQMGYEGYIQAAFAISGLTVGVFLGTVFLVLYKRFSRRTNVVHLSDECDSKRIICKNMLMIALPVTITASALYMTQFLDTLLINQRLMHAGYTNEAADLMYSAYSTLSLSISDLLPSTFVYPIAVSILPAVSAALAVKKMKSVRKYIMQSVRISGIIAIPCSLCLAVLAKPCITLIYGQNWGMGEGGTGIQLLNGTGITPVDLAANSLTILAFGVFLISMLSTTNALLQALGKVYYPMISVCTGVVFLIIAEVSLVSAPAVGIYGAPIATLICYTVALSINMLRLSKQAGGLNMNPLKLFLKPLIAAAISALICIAVYGTGLLVTGGSFGRLESLIYIAVSAVIAVPAYAVSLIAMNGITVGEIQLLPKGNLLAAFLLRKGLIKGRKTN